VEHTLLNEGPGAIEAAPWAITQFPLGGSALMPLAAPGAEGLQASHSLILWPYTDLSDPRLRWGEQAMLIETVAGPKLKVGSGPAPGRLGYLRQGHLFTKEVAPVGPGTYPDRGAVAQVYADGSFCELESVGPIAELAPGAAVSHTELWAVEACDGLEAAHRTVVEGRVG
jgi:hypothetical protein